MKKNEGSLTQNIIKVLSANFLVAIMGLLSGFVFPKILSIDAYAVYQTFTLYVGYLAITHLGFPSGMMINYAGKNYNEINTQRYKAELSILFSILLIFTIIFVIIYIASGNKMIAYIAIATIPTGITGSYKSLLQSWNRFTFYSRLNTVISTIIPIVAIAYYFIAGNLPGETFVYIYLFVYWVVTIYIIKEMVTKVKGIKSDPIFSRENWNTEKIGAALVIGNYVNVLFTSADKQFVKIFFHNTEFAYYSFGMSMQTLMTVFITSIAQPLFPAMAKGGLTDNDYNNIKKLLMVFGSLSGCAYFGASIVVKLFIQKYIPSLNVVAIYFLVFPAMAVINCLYINLYKIKGKMKQYILTLAIILCIAILLNYIFVKIWPDYTGVAIATVITYYIWLIVGSFQFRFLKITLIDVLYLILFSIGYILITKYLNDWIGIFLYLIFAVLLALIFYKDIIIRYLKRIIKKD